MPVYMLILILGIATMFTTQNIESWYYAVPVFNTALALQGNSYRRCECDAVCGDTGRDIDPGNDTDHGNRKSI